MLKLTTCLKLTWPDWYMAMRCLYVGMGDEPVGRPTNQQGACGCARAAFTDDEGPLLRGLELVDAAHDVLRNVHPHLVLVLEGKQPHRGCSSSIDFGVPLDMAQALAPAALDESASADGVPEAKAATPSPRSFSLFGDDAAPAGGDEESVDDLIARAAALRESAVASGELQPRAPEEPAKPEEAAEAAEKPAAPEEPAAPSAPEPPAEPEPAKAASPPKKPGPIGGAEPSTPARPAPADELTFESAGTARSRRSQG